MPEFNGVVSRVSADQGSLGEPAHYTSGQYGLQQFFRNGDLAQTAGLLYAMRRNGNPRHGHSKSVLRDEAANPDKFFSKSEN
jgi:hypothetical protein